MLYNRFIPVILAGLLAIILLPGICFSSGPPGEGYVTTGDGVRLFYKIVGQGATTLVVVHGGPGNTMDSILPDFKPLAEHFRIIYYDQRGCGRSTLVLEENRLTIARHVKDLEAIRLHFNLDKLDMIGNSWGGLLASYYAVQYPDNINRLVLLSPVSPSIRLLQASVGFIQQRIPESRRSRLQLLSIPAMWIKSNDPRETCREFFDIIKPVYFPDMTRAQLMKGELCGGPVQAVRLQKLVNERTWQALGDWNILPALDVVRAPVLVIHGSNDMIPVKSSVTWSETFPNSRLLIIKDSGHMTHVEQPQTFFRAMQTFFQGSWPKAAVNVRGADNLDDGESPLPAIIGN